MIVRHWFPVITSGITLTLLFGVWAVYANRTQQPERIPAETRGVLQPALSEEEYQAAIRTILTTYQTDNDADAAYDTLLYITRIPANMKDPHIGLVGAFGKLAGGDREDGERRLGALRAQYSWLIL